MPITLIVAPDSAQPGRTGPFSREVMRNLIEHANLAGKAIALHSCHSDTEVIEHLRSANETGSEFVIFDPGDCDCSSTHVHAMLDALKMPWIEAHNDDFGALEQVLSRRRSPCISIVQGYGSQSYTLALSIALEHLGCSECENSYHVGT